MKNNLESSHQKTIIEWCEWQKAKYPELDMIFHITNEGKRSKTMGAELKRMGLKRGIPDICLPVPNEKYNGLWIELKADKTKRLSNEQKEWLEKLNSYGYKAVRCNGADEAIQVIKDYLNIKTIF
ncbi:MAG TPA: VRR-NUC domain-containing protein [Terrisporobacter glycolicus]|uniref:VRR-NUC domain-containing protein n=1 Tax=Terrisporobacter TaxID=1505652 RepID=UPI000E924DFE|nr:MULTISPECIES: VRR-NUC domain-containing protein [Terrisporobacter]HBI91177.1 VRR-NUC domain-containing protein [Terrisporobacter hibernicus]